MSDATRSNATGISRIHNASQIGFGSYADHTDVCVVITTVGHDASTKEDRRDDRMDMIVSDQALGDRSGSICPSVRAGNDPAPVEDV